MGFSQWNNQEKIRMNMENDYLEQKYRGDDPERAREIYNGKARIWFLAGLLVVLAVVLTLVVGSL